MNDEVKVVSFRIPEAVASKVTKRLGFPAETLSDLCRLSFFSMLHMDDSEFQAFIRQGENGEIEWERQKLKVQEKHQDIIFVRKELDIIGKASVHRAIREGYIPETCNKDLPLLNRAFSLWFKKYDDDEIEKDKLKVLFDKLLSMLPELGNHPENVRNRNDAENQVKFWKELEFSDEDIQKYFQDFQGIELLEE